MALLLDDAHWSWRGRMWCHLVSDTSLAELHAFAEWIGIPRRGFQGDHYDIPEEVRPIALEEGATRVSSREIVLALYASGIRQRPLERSPRTARAGAALTTPGPPRPSLAAARDPYPGPPRRVPVRLCSRTGE